MLIKTITSEMVRGQVKTSYPPALWSLYFYCQQYVLEAFEAVLHNFACHFSLSWSWHWNKNTSFNSVDIHPLCFPHTINLCLVLTWNFYLYHKFTWTEWNNDNKEPSTLTLSICILIFFKLGFGSSTCLIWGILSQVLGIWQNTQYGNPDALGNLWQGEGRKEQIWCQASLSFNSLNRCWGDI